MHEYSGPEHRAGHKADSQPTLHKVQIWPCAVLAPFPVVSLSPLSPASQLLHRVFLLSAFSILKVTVCKHWMQTSFLSLLFYMKRAHCSHRDSKHCCLTQKAKEKLTEKKKHSGKRIPAESSPNQISHWLHHSLEIGTELWYYRGLQLWT